MLHTRARVRARIETSMQESDPTNTSAIVFGELETTLAFALVSKWLVNAQLTTDRGTQSTFIDSYKHKEYLTTKRHANNTHVNHNFLQSP